MYGAFKTGLAKTMTNELSNTDFLVCTLASDWAQVPSFNVGCDFCGARIWVHQDAPIEPTRLCPACAAIRDDAKRNMIELVIGR